MKISRQEPCRGLQIRVLELGVRALNGDEEAQNHAAECPKCFDFLEAVAALDDGLASLETENASDALVSDLLERVATEQVRMTRSEVILPEGDGLSDVVLSEDAPSKAERARVLPWSRAVRRLRALSPGQLAQIAAAAMAFVLIPLVILQRQEFAPESQSVAQRNQAVQVEASDVASIEPAGDDRSDRATQTLPKSKPEARPSEMREGQAQPADNDLARRLESLGYLSEAEREPLPEAFEKKNRDTTLGPKNDSDKGALAAPPSSSVQEAPSIVGNLSSARPSGRRAQQAQERVGGKDEIAQIGSVVEEVVVTSELPMLDERKLASGTTVSSPEEEPVVGQEKFRAGNESAGRSSELPSGMTQSKAKRAPKPSRANDIPSPDPAKEAAVVDGLSVFADPESTEDAGRSEAHTAVAEFLAQRSVTEGLIFQAAEGYWANTYLPGDPALRLLESRLRSTGLEDLRDLAGSDVLLHGASALTVQPFDPPDRAALAVYVNSDLRGLQGPGRALLQIGLQASSRGAARRGSMNVCLVVDVRGDLTAEQSAMLRAAVTAFERSRSAGDRFQLIFAGRSFGAKGARRTGLDSPDLRHGNVRVALDQLLDEDLAGPNGLSLKAAMDAAVAKVAEGDDSEASLGSSAVVLLTPAVLGRSLSALERVAHGSAVAGIPVSVIGVGPAVQLRELKRLALAGQGNRRLIVETAEAEKVLESELTAAGQVVARALRLRIRLAPGVKLVDVVGSHRLGSRAADRVRDAERSVDQRLARNLGIESDRGDDEDGIQIVIPAFYAGDAHVVLLDVVAPGPGPLGDVTLRYKDLVHSRNGVASARGAISRREREPGSLQNNVLKNLLAHELSAAMERAGLAAGSGDEATALRELQSIRDLLLGLQMSGEPLEDDPELRADVRMLDEYLLLLRRGVLNDPNHRSMLADSMAFASQSKILRPRGLPAVR